MAGSPIPGWYPDPGHPEKVRFGDGSSWTDNIQDAIPGRNVPVGVTYGVYNPRPFGDTGKTSDERYVSFGQAIKLGFQRYARFSGRSSRSEYWWWYLFSFLILFVPLILGLILLVIDLRHRCFVNGEQITPCNGHGNSAAIALVIFGAIAGLALILPSLAILVRRLHDTERTGVWALVFILLPGPLGAIKIIGLIADVAVTIWQIVWMSQEGTRGRNQYGDAPCEGRERAARLAGVDYHAAP